MKTAVKQRKKPTKKGAKASLEGDSSSSTFQRRLFITPSPSDSRQRSLPPNLGMDAAALTPDRRHLQMVADGRVIYTGWGAVSGAVHRKADMAIGSAWTPVYRGADQKFKEAAESLMAAWTQRCDVRGIPFDFAKDLWLLSKSIDVDGDIGILFTRDADGWPRHQLLESHRVGQVGGIVRGGYLTPPTVIEGEYAGRWIYNGVITDDTMRPLAYRVIKPGVNPSSGVVGPDQYQDIPARSMTMAWDPTWYTSARGIPSLCYGILDWYDAFETRDAEKIAAKVNSSLSLIGKNATGSAPPSSDLILGSLSSTSPTTELAAGGMIRYIMHADSLESHKSERPSGGWQWLMDHAIRCAMLGMDMPMETVYDMAKLGGASVRAVFQQMQRSIERRQSVVWPIARRMTLHAVATFIAGGMLPFTRDWYRWDFTYPARASVDVGRDAQNRREDYRMGLGTFSAIMAEQGESADAAFRERADDYLKAKEISDSTGVPIDYLISPEVMRPPGIAAPVELLTDED
jgi:capsid protein